VVKPEEGTSKRRKKMFGWKKAFTHQAMVIVPKKIDYIPTLVPNDQFKISKIIFFIAIEISFNITGGIN
jgi:hypothetical protein